MNIKINKTMESLNGILSNADLSHMDLCKAYEITTRLRSQLLGAIGEIETFDQPEDLQLADILTTGINTEGIVTLTINESLPALKEMTSAIQDHWLNLVHIAIKKAASDRKLTYFQKAFVWIEISAPEGVNNKKLWDTLWILIGSIMICFRVPYDDLKISWGMIKWDSGTAIMCIVER